MVNASRVKAYGALVAVFVLGGVCGAAAHHWTARREYAEFFSGDREAFETRRVEALSHELGLGDEQAARVQDVFRRHAESRRRLMREANETCGGPMNAHRERIDAEIRALLDPAQRVRFDEIRAQRKKRLFGAPSGSAGSSL